MKIVGLNSTVCYKPQCVYGAKTNLGNMNLTWPEKVRNVSAMVMIYSRNLTLQYSDVQYFNHLKRCLGMV